MPRHSYSVIPTLQINLKFKGTRIEYHMHLCSHMYLFEDIGEGQVGSVVLHQSHLGGYSHHPWHGKA